MRSVALALNTIGSGAYAYPLNITSSGALTVSTSDMRMKTNVMDIDDGLQRVMGLRGVRFNWKEGEVAGGTGWPMEPVKG